jgi:Outer membrane protein beta-barrel domain
MLKNILFLAFFVALSSTAFAQKPRYGIKTGLNVFTFMGGTETDSDGKALDRNNAGTGFQVGITGALPLTDIFGVQAELLYTQRGSKYFYEGKGFQVITDANNRKIEVKGDLRTVLLVDNSHIEVPLLVYIKPIKQMRIEAGISPMILLSSTATGEFLLKNRTYGSNIKMKDSALVTLKYDYIKDGAGQGVTPTSANANVVGEYKEENIGGDKYRYLNAEGAYYNNAEKPDGENLYKFFDLGANIGVGYTFSSGLAFNLRATYGLLDATNNRYERKFQTNTGAPNYKVQQFDRDIRNFNVALTIGFSF